jgi:hypothetical protein
MKVKLLLKKDPIFSIFFDGWALPTGLEPITYGLEVRCSIQLSYESNTCPQEKNRLKPTRNGITIFFHFFCILCIGEF